ncbi:hypothetical protein LSH36_362g02059 [Paralvinella palmiformis]|uniref:CAP-Gly domain-containing protein n=1 Tax=Paralvinella palmiformis TaxID=53620 RepID=A0AAD9N258_9ANNE|nr:hypothetical protein LSH36_362g02059 [Paralvinella palmiformis]
MKARDDEQDVDPFLCRCSKCKRFWLDHFSENDLKRLKDPPLLRALKSNCMYAAVQQKEDHAAVLKIGDRVTVNSSQLQVGSVHNGIVNCKRYFHCPRGHGLMVKYGEVVRINPPVKKPPVKGNYMFPSFEEIKKRRRIRSLLDPELDLGPLYTAKGAAAEKKGYNTTTEKVGHGSKGGRRGVKQEQTSAETRDYTKEPPRELINRWNKEKFGGGKRGEIKAKTLYKLYAAYQKGEQYKRAEESGDATSSSDESSVEGDDTDRQQGSSESKQRNQQKSA